MSLQEMLTRHSFRKSIRAASGEVISCMRITRQIALEDMQHGQFMTWESESSIAEVKSEIALIDEELARRAAR